MHNFNKVRQYFDEKYPHIRLSEVKALHLQQYYNWMYENSAGVARSCDLQYYR